MEGTERTRRTAQIRISLVIEKVGQTAVIKYRAPTRIYASNFLPADRRAEIAPAENVKIPVVMKLHEMLRTLEKA
jgi:hypothetical protein